MSMRNPNSNEYIFNQNDILFKNEKINQEIIVPNQFLIK